MYTIIKNMNTLKAMAKRNLIQLHEDTDIHGYIKDAPKSYFEYKGNSYRVKYYDGCFSPFVELYKEPHTKIVLTETKYKKNPHTKTTYREVSKETREVTKREHYLATNNDTLKWFRRLGCSEYVERSYTFEGYLPTRVISTSRDKENKTIREYEFIKVN